jgi:LmbE family N-acetylglucosaminyl deacetylase
MSSFRGRHRLSPPNPQHPARASDIKVLLGVWAHPDDEAYLSAGLMASVRAAGGRVVVVTATRGELGTSDPYTWPPARLARVRERELAASLAALDVHEHHWLDYTDGELSDVPISAGAARVADVITAVRPDTIVTFGPDGLTGHTDHQAISAWVDAARPAAPAARVWHATFTPAFHAAWSDVSAAAGLWMPGARPPSTPPDRLALSVDCDDDLLDQKLVALRAHASQTAALVELLGVERYRQWWATESFAPARAAAASAASTAAHAAAPTARAKDVAA